jgi:hypothetical protein
MILVSTNYPYLRVGHHILCRGAVDLLPLVLDSTDFIMEWSWPVPESFSVC